MPDFELLDITFAAEGDDEPRPKVGDQASGQGVGQDCAFFGVDGFVSIPNPPDASGGCAQAVTMTIGNDRCVIGSLDGRYNDKAGTLSPGDRAIVSNCDARVVLDQSANSVGVLSSEASAVVGPGSVSLSISTGPTDASITISDSALVITYSHFDVLASITFAPGGGVAIVAPSGVTVNGVPLVVP